MRSAFSISVLLRTFNSAKILDRTLGAIPLADGDEYIVVDSGSTDTTLSIAAAHGAKIIIASGPFNYSKSLNLGFRAAQNPWVLVLSSHSISLVPDLLEIYRAAMLELSPETAVIYGPNTLNGRHLYRDDQVRFFNQKNYQIVDHLCGNGNALYRRSLWEQISFDETIRTGEDKAWMQAIFDRGGIISLASGARTLNRSQYPLRYMFMKGYSDMRAAPHEPLSIMWLGRSLASLTKIFLSGGMPLGNLIRYCAHIVGRFFGSRQEQDNTPYIF